MFGFSLDDMKKERQSDLKALLRDLYASEINISISCFWDGGWDIALGDAMNGWRAKTCIDNLDHAPKWIIAEAKRAWPDSQFAAEH